MPAVVRRDPLAVEFAFSNGTRFMLKLHDLPCPEMVADMASGLAGLAHPHDQVDSRGTAQNYRVALKKLGIFLDSLGFSGGAGDLTRARLVEFWLGTNRHVESMTRRMLRSWNAETGALRPEVRDYLTGQLLHAPKRNRDKKPFAPYSDVEWERLRTCCQNIIDTASARQKAALATAREAGDLQDLPAMGWSTDSLVGVLLRHGPMSPPQMVAAMDNCVRLTAAQREAWSHASSLLFPSVEVALAYRLLLGMTTGVVPDGLDDLEIADIDWAGDSTVLLDYVKGRSGPQSLTLPKRGVRVLRRWLEHSALLRRFAPEDVRPYLWLTHVPQAYRYFHAARFDGLTTQKWVAAHGVRADDGTPLRIHRHRIRTTFENRRDKSAWTGRTTIDPNHTPQVEGDHYLSRPTAAQQDALNAVIEDAQSDLVRKATMPVLLTSDDAAAAASALPEHVVGLELTDTVVAELVGGVRDVFTAACADQLAGLHGPPGKPCPARPWVCLLCPLAVFTPRHVPNLLRLKAFFARQFRRMPLPHFMAVFGAYAHRLDQDILPRFAPAVLTAASSEVRDTDDELPLRPEETT